MTVCLVLWYHNAVACQSVSQSFHQLWKPSWSTYSTSGASELSVYITWPGPFQMQWGTMPVRIQNATASGQRPSRSNFCHIIRGPADELRKLEANPAGLQSLTVAHKMVRQWEFISDMLGDRLEVEIPPFYHSLKYRTSRQQLEPLKKRCPADTYGCTGWQNWKQRRSEVSRDRKIILNKGGAELDKEVENLTQVAFYITW